MLNTVATADISFMLLIFFLVTSSMDTDQGLRRRLPVMHEQKDGSTLMVDRADVLTLTLTADQTLLVDGEATPVTSLQPLVNRYLESHQGAPLVLVEVSEAADYSLYFAVQDELTGAYRKARTSLSESYYGRSLQQLTADELAVIDSLCPWQVTEKAITETPVPISISAESP